MVWNVHEHRVPDRPDSPVDASLPDDGLQAGRDSRHSRMVRAYCLLAPLSQGTGDCLRLLDRLEISRKTAARSGLKAGLNLPADLMPLILFVEPFLQRGEIIHDGGGIDLFLAR